MHDGTIAQADTWLQSNINSYAQWAKANNSLLILDWDEDDGTQNNQVAAILYGAGVTTGTNSTHYDHYNMLSTILAAYGLTGPRNAATASPIQVFGTSTITAPTVSWSPATQTGVEGSAIALGAITPISGNNSLSSVLVSGLAVGASLTDGKNTFTAATGTTSVNILGWNYAALSLTPPNDANETLSVQVTDANGSSAPSTEAVTVKPLAPTVAPVAVSGAVGQAIPLTLGIAANGLSGDSNSLSSVTLSGIPAGAALSNTKGDTLTVAGGAITFSATQLAAGVLNGLAVTTTTAGNFTLSVAAVEADAQGDASATTTATEAVTVGSVASGKTISTSIAGPVILGAADNPLTVTSTGAVTLTAAGADAIDGPAIASVWTVSNAGVISSALGTGLSLASSGIVTNSGSTSGKEGILLRGGGSVTNNAGGSIAASGAVGGGRSVGAGYTSRAQPAASRTMARFPAMPMALPSPVAEWLPTPPRLPAPRTA